jgi:hypothetical protein
MTDSVSSRPRTALNVIYHATAIAFFVYLFHYFWTGSGAGAGAFLRRVRFDRAHELIAPVPFSGTTR